uniref:Nodulin-like domain-containing protein n=1 Tax=Physcomitrium patens TaxID=3218 RepID=A0A7I4CEF7_PHYPA
MAWTNRWLVLVASIWLQACAGIGYIFGSISPVIKTNLNLNQRQLNRLGVAKDLGDSVGLLAGFLSDWLPSWGLILVGLLHNCIGYGWVWLIVIRRVATPPFAVVCLLIALGTNGETYFNTAALVSSVRTFSHYRGPVVGILKGFAGLGGAIFTCVYTAFFAPDQASFILIIADSPSASKNTDRLFAIGLFTLLALPLALVIPSALEKQSSDYDKSFQDEAGQLRAPLLDDVENEVAAGGEGRATVVGSVDGKASGQCTATRAWKESPRLKDQDLLLFSELEDEKETLPEPVRRDRMRRASSRLYRAVAEGAVKVKRKRKGPHRGEDFTMRQALVKADLWLLFFGLVCGAGSGLMVIDNLGQISQSLGYKDPHIFVALISIWNFLGRLGGGYVSEVIARGHALPRPILIVGAQAITTIGHASLAVGMQGSLYAGSLLVGLGYGAHWAIVPATASELFGLKNFGMLYNFLAMANPTGSLIFSGLIAGTLYDWEAQKQHGGVAPRNGEALRCEGPVCFRLTLFIMTGMCMLGAVLNTILIFRTRRVYTMLYGKTQRDDAVGEEARDATASIQN